MKLSEPGLAVSLNGIVVEHHSRFLTKRFGSPHKACYFLGAVIFTIGLIRDHYYKQAIQHQPTLTILDQTIVQLIAKASFAIGATLVITSMWSLGFTGTYLGDYFGILMPHMVHGFPFNLSSSPMYHGSTLCFLATALSYRSPAGLILTALVYIVYQIALRFEESLCHDVAHQID
ncbi:methylene-fatty-acyl-phospholipid synthase [Puccinia sorghi]|uniref:Phosphatidyl-N-methylethanolamine N-methyltransferase n=1 Tax=Puccinia sorghi TaxID=27349 RepID=A0A0L6UT15_9BASI|nr:methylene-fatty-acyl-phospholipid synthase [Puccinia sorghi]